MAVPGKEEAAKEMGVTDCSEVGIAFCVPNSFGYEDFEEFALNFEDYDLWEAIQNHLSYPILKTTCKYLLVCWNSYVRSHTPL